jgi:hypothetical protein
MSVIFHRCRILYNSAFCLFDALLRAYTLSLFLRFAFLYIKLHTYSNYCTHNNILE